MKINRIGRGFSYNNQKSTINNLPNKYGSRNQVATYGFVTGFALRTGAGSIKGSSGMMIQAIG